MLITLETLLRERELEIRLQQGSSLGKKFDLPNSVQHVLPDHARAIYMKAFNSVWDEYKEGSKRKGSRTREETAHSVAWAVVKKKYQKLGDGKWREK